jgi:hypothetical protein
MESYSISMEYRKWRQTHFSLCYGSLYHRVVFVFLGLLHQLNWDALRNPAFDPTFHTLAPLNCATSELASVPRYCSPRTRENALGVTTVTREQGWAVIYDDSYRERVYKRYETWLQHGRECFRTDQENPGFSVNSKAVDTVYLYHVVARTKSWPFSPSLV